MLFHVRKENIMEKYSLIKKELDNILNNDEIKYDGTYISSYELKNIISNEFKDIYAVFEKESSKNINNKSTNKRSIEIKLRSDEEKKLQKIKFTISHASSLSIKWYTISIYKENETNKVFFEPFPFDNTSKNFLAENFEYIATILKKMDYYNKLFKIKFCDTYMYSPLLKQDFNYSIFKISYSFLTKSKITIAPMQNELNHIFELTNLSRECLNSYAQKNIDELAKRIPIKIEELNPLFKQIIESSLKKEKTLQLKK